VLMEIQRMSELKGLEIAKEFFFEWGHPFLKENFPQITGRKWIVGSDHGNLLLI